MIKQSLRPGASPRPSKKCAKILLATATLALFPVLSSNAQSTLYWNTASGDFGTAGNWSTDPNTGGSGSVPGAADSIVFNQSSVNGDEIITLGSARSVHGITFNNTGTTTVQGSSTNLLIGAGGITIGANAGAVTFGGAGETFKVNTRLTADQTWTNDSGDVFTLNGNRSPGFSISVGTASAVNLTLAGSSPFKFFSTVSNGGIDRTLGITVDTTSTVTFAAASSTAHGFTGGLTIKSGTVNAENGVNNMFGTGTITLGDTTGNKDAALTGTSTRSFANVINVRATGGLKTLAAGTYTGPITLDGDLTLGSSTTVSNLTGAGNITVNSGSTSTPVRIGGNNPTYTGNITVDTGILTMTSATGLSSANTVAVNSSATYSLGGMNQTIAGLNNGGSGGGTVTAGATVDGTYTLTVGGNGNYTFGGILTNSSSARKLALNVNLTNGGSQTLTGANTYTGDTTITSGTLILGATGSLASPTIRIGTGGTFNASAVSGGFILGAGKKLENKGTFIGQLTMGSGSTFAPGNSPGIATHNGDLTLNTGSNYEWELVANTTSGAGTNFDQTVFTSGGLTIQTGVTANLVFNFAGSTVDWADSFWDSNHAWLQFSGANGLTNVTDIFTAIAIGDDSLGQNFSLTGGTFSFSTSGNDIYLNYTVVPEPAGTALLVAGAGMMTFLRRRRSGSQKR